MEGDCEARSAAQPVEGGCRLMWTGMCRLWNSARERRKSLTIARADSDPVELQVQKLPQLIQLHKPRRLDLQEAPGTFPHRAVQLPLAIVQYDIAVQTVWYGRADLMGYCLQFDSTGEFVQALWPGNRGSLDSDGVRVEKPPECLPGSRQGKTEILLRLDGVPTEVFSCFFMMVAREPSGVTADGFIHIETAGVQLAAFGQPFWRYYQENAYCQANMWICAAMYRGPHDTWRLEPMNMKHMLMALKYDSETAEGMAEVARSLKEKLSWFNQDRRWTTVAEQRRLMNP